MLLSSHPKENEGDNNNKPNRNHGTKPLIKQFTSNTKKRERDYLPTKRNKRSMTVIPRLLKAWSVSHAFCYSKNGKTPAPFLSLFSDPLSPCSSLFLLLLSLAASHYQLSYSSPQQAWHLQPPAWSPLPLAVSTRPMQLLPGRKGVPLLTSKKISRVVPPTQMEKPLVRVYNTTMIKIT